MSKRGLFASLRLLDCSPRVQTQEASGCSESFLFRWRSSCCGECKIVRDNRICSYPWLVIQDRTTDFNDLVEGSGDQQMCSIATSPSHLERTTPGSGDRAWGVGCVHSVRSQGRGRE